MPKRLNLKDILNRNPHITEKEVLALGSVTEMLRQVGVHLRGYQLPSPYERRLAKPFEEESDSRTVNLSASSPKKEPSAP
jgi:hypothetical protein